MGSVSPIKCSGWPFVRAVYSALESRPAPLHSAARTRRATALAEASSVGSRNVESLSHLAAYITFPRPRPFRIELIT